MDPAAIMKWFPKEIEFPEALRVLCLWEEHLMPPRRTGFYDFPPYLRRLFRLPSPQPDKWISGYFRLAEDKYEFVRHWFGSDTVVDRFGAFGTGPDGSQYVIWLQDDGRCPIVHMGSEGQNNFVLAGDMVDFIRLLAVGYDEIGFADLTRPPGTEYVSKPFQEWVTSTFHVLIPQTGIEIAGPARASHQDFQAWIDGIIESTGERT
jgi:hypothetical protein